jgi:hypothetical protein
VTEILLVGCSLGLTPLHVFCIPFHVRFYLVATLAYYIVVLIINFEDDIGKIIESMVPCNLHL